jgi:microcystin-dependent protein
VEFTKGRVIVGVGEGKGLTSRHLLENGGEEQHKLTIEEMPRHKHVWRGVSNKKHDEYGFEGSEQNVYKEPGSSIDNIGEAAGEGKPHNNMPPFVALLYCEKQ